MNELMMSQRVDMENEAADSQLIAVGEDLNELEELTWGEPVQRVQALADKGLQELPSIYIRPPSERPSLDDPFSAEETVPVIDFAGLEDERREKTMSEIGKACEEWGFFQLLHHGIPLSLIAKTRKAAKEFFDLPIEEKQIYANKPWSLVGYGSRIGVTKGAVLDWGDYFLHYLWPIDKRDVDKEWPKKPASYIETVDEYSREVHKLCSRLMEVFSENLGLRSSYVGEVFGWPDMNLVLRINYYPPCPRPDLTLGVAAHSDGGGLTLLLQDDVQGLQVHKGDHWLKVDPIPNAIIINVADQLQILSNGKYKSVEHRVVVNNSSVRMSLATFCNPDVETTISPAYELIDDNHPSSYRETLYGQFLQSVFREGLKGKGHIESLRA